MHTTRTYEQKIQWLRRYREEEQDIQHICDDLARWKSIAERATPDLLGMPHSKADGSRTERAVEKLDALRLQLADCISALIDLRGAVAQAVDTIPNARLRLLLEYRYIDGLTYGRIAGKLSITEKWVIKQHRRAIEQLIIDT